MLLILIAFVVLVLLFKNSKLLCVNGKDEEHLPLAKREKSRDFIIEPLYNDVGTFINFVKKSKSDPKFTSKQEQYTQVKLINLQLEYTKKNEDCYSFKYVRDIKEPKDKLDKNLVLTLGNSGNNRLVLKCKEKSTEATDISSSNLNQFTNSVTCSCDSLNDKQLAEFSPTQLIDEMKHLNNSISLLNVILRRIEPNINQLQKTYPGGSIQSKNNNLKDFEGYIHDNKRITEKALDLVHRFEKLYDSSRSCVHSTSRKSK